MALTQALIKNKIDKSIKNKKCFIAAVLATSTIDYQKLTIEVLRYLTKNNVPGVYITINKPYSYLKRQLIKANISIDNIIFIDAITKSTGGIIEEDKNCFYIDDPEHLTDLGIAITEAVESLNVKDKFLFFDSLSILSTYHSENIVIKFVHFLVTKMREWEIKGILMSLSKEEAIVTQLSQFLDLTVDFGGTK